jgi:2-C-methyl-D-erythritol 4-phosphate cytidylyltransferase
VHALDACPDVTDESSAVEALGLAPLCVPGHPCNLKVTRPGDLALAALYLGVSADE